MRITRIQKSESSIQYREDRIRNARILSTGSCFLTAFFGLLTLSSFALGPHEVLLLANRQSPRSLEIARDYAALRHIPAINLIELELPANPGFEMSSAEFSAKIWEPVQQALRERGIADHILAWAYSVDFPIRIAANPPLSLQGLTFLKGRMPASESVAQGSYGSPLFAGPDTPRIAGFPAQSLDAQRAWLGQDMPVPSMMLGYMGPNGNTREEIMACLKAGYLSDHTAPDGTALILTNSDVRSRCREWEFAGAIRELQARGITALMAATPPASNSPTPLIGVMAGAETLPDIAGKKFTFLPGAIAEHLTSFGAAFDNNSQTKITEWIRAGATASAGTVTEPLSNWAKFPHARVFAHQVAGCTTLESLTQSIRCPLQILLLGDPLASPWSPRSLITLQGLTNGVLMQPTVVTASITARDGDVFSRFLFLLDGKTLQAAGTSPKATLIPATLKPGPHTVRAIAYKVGSVRAQIFADANFEVKENTP